MPKSLKSHQLPFTAASDVKLGPNGARQALILSTHTTDAYAIAFGEDASLNKGISIPTLTAPIILTRELLGDMICLPIHGIASGAISVGITEISGD